MKMPRLFIQRDPLLLVEKEGAVESFEKLPDILAKNPLVAHPWFIDKKLKRKSCELFIHPKNKYSVFAQPGWLDLNFDMPLPRVNALWSGYRSCITWDYWHDALMHRYSRWDKKANLYKLKGIAFGDEISIDEDEHVVGGQHLSNAKYEKEYSDKFNRILIENGIQPAMEYVGQYHYQARAKKRKIAASIIKVAGDTRLDELMFAVQYEISKTIINLVDAENVESLLNIIVPPIYHTPTKYSKKQKQEGLKKICHLEKRLNVFFNECGYIAGHLVQLLHKNNQTWSDNPERTNAHIGNILVYETSQNEIRLGLVDFDASCDLKAKSKIELKVQQEAEAYSLIKSLTWGNISSRPILTENMDITSFNLISNSFAAGFEMGYRSKKEASNTIKKEYLYEILNCLPEPQKKRLDEITEKQFEVL